MAKKGSRRKKEQQVQRQTRKQIARSRKDARQNRIILISLIGLAAIIILVLGFGVIQELVIKPSRPVATVNGNKIPADLFQDLVTYYRYNQYVTIANLEQGLEELQSSPEDNEFLISFYEQQLAQLESQLITIPDTALDALIEDELIRERAEEENITVTQQDAAASIEAELREALSQPQEAITDTQTLLDSTPVPQTDVDDLYASVLENIGIPKKSFEEIRRRELLRSQLQEVLASEVVTTGLVVHPQIIETETEEEALAAKQRIEAGEEFSIVAQEVSTDTLSVDSGGDLDWVAEGQVSARYGQELEDAIFGLPASDELQVIQSGETFYVLQILERDENGPLPESILSQRRSSALIDWLEERKNSPDVTIERLLEDDQIPEDPFRRTQQIFE